MKLPSHSPYTRGFSLLEMVGVLAVLSILAAVLLPNAIRKIAAAHASKEEQNLKALAQGLKDYVASRQTVPGATAWETNIAETTGLNLSEVRYVSPADTNSARVILVHPSFTPSTGSNPVFAMTSDGDVAPTNARVLIISTTKSSLTLPVTSGKATDTAPNRTEFENIWDWNFDPATKAPPAGWPVGWNNNGEYLQVAKINLAPLFHHVTFSNAKFPTDIPFAKFNNLTTVAYDLTNAVDAYYLEGTVIRLYKHDTPYTSPPADPDELDLTHTVESDVNFLYDGETVRWSIP